MKDVEFFDMFVKPTLFNIHKFDHYHSLVPSWKNTMKKYYAILVRRSWNILVIIDQSAFYLEVYLTILLIHRESEAFNQFNDQNSVKSSATI